MSELDSKILEELQKINSSLSIKEVYSAKHPKPTFGEFVIGEISSLNKQLITISHQLAAIQNKLDKK